MRRAERGFTLLEVMIALAILFGALVMMLSTVTADVQHTQEAKLMSAATGLARAKMLDIEEELLTKGFQEMVETMEGDFADDGFPRYSWKATIEKVELPALQQMQTAQGAEAASGTPTLPGMPAGGTQPGAPSDAMGASMLSGQFEMISGVLEQAIRKVTLTVTWKVGRDVQDLVIVCYFTDPKAVDSAFPSF